jgi:hypothetical protein
VPEPSTHVVPFLSGPRILLGFFAGTVASSAILGGASFLNTLYYASTESVPWPWPEVWLFATCLAALAAGWLDVSVGIGFLWPLVGSALWGGLPDVALALTILCCATGVAVRAEVEHRRRARESAPAFRSRPAGR